MKADSPRNWPTICRCEAPMALRMPISRVRSSTDMVMVLTTDSPPTSREMSATPKMMLLKILVMLLNWSMKACGPDAVTLDTVPSMVEASWSASTPGSG